MSCACKFFYILNKTFLSWSSGSHAGYHPLSGNLPHGPGDDGHSHEGLHRGVDLSSAPLSSATH